MAESIPLTQYSHGAGCGCKISPKVLDVILAGSGAQNLALAPIDELVARGEYTVEVV